MEGGSPGVAMSNKVVIPSSSSSSTSGHGSDSETNHYDRQSAHTKSSKSPSKSSNSSSVHSSNSSEPSNFGANNKVMIVTGDRGNMVVDLSQVPQGLRDAILSGTALITLPEGINDLLQPGYAMIDIPPDEGDDAIKNAAAFPYGVNNKTQFWDVMQHNGSTIPEKHSKKNSKKLTTVFPFHPNQDTYVSPIHFFLLCFFGKKHGKF